MPSTEAEADSAGIGAAEESGVGRTAMTPDRAEGGPAEKPRSRNGCGNKDMQQRERKLHVPMCADSMRQQWKATLANTSSPQSRNADGERSSGVKEN